MKNNNTKEHILKQGMSVVKEKGFKNAGLSEILKSASVPKGSFYYYFDSKTDFGVEMLSYAADSFFSEMQSYFSPEIEPIKRIEDFLGDQIAYFRRGPSSCNCLFGKLTQELTEEDPLLRKKLSEIFDSWQQLFQKALEEAQEKKTISPEKSPEKLARFILSGWEGALMQSKLLQSVQPLEEFKEIIIQLILS